MSDISDIDGPRADLDSCEKERKNDAYKGKFAEIEVPFEKGNVECTPVVDLYSNNPSFHSGQAGQSPGHSDCGSTLTDPQVVSQATLIDSERGIDGEDTGDYSWLEDVADLANSI